MRISAISTMIFIATFALWVPDSAAKNEVYRWVDENGVIHYGDQVESPANAERVEIQRDLNRENQAAPDPATTVDTQQAEPQPSYAQQLRDERAQKRAEATEVAQETEEACEKVREMVATLEPSNRVMVTGEDGSVSRMDGEVRVQKVAEGKAFLDEYCNK